MSAAELSRILFAPTTVVLYAVAMALYLYGMAFTRVDRTGDAPAVAGTRAIRIGTAVASLGLVAHLGHLVARSVAAGGRVPWGNMFEFSSVMGLGVVAAGLLIFQWRLNRPDVVGFLLLAALLSMGAASLLYTDPGPLVPVLNTQWLKIHVFAIMSGATIFTVGFVFTALYLLRDVAEQRVADRDLDRAEGSTVGAMQAPPGGDGAVAVADHAEDQVARGASPAEYGRALRATINPWWLAGTTWLATGTLSWMFQDVARFLMVNTAMAASALVAWWFVGSLPSAATLDSLAYRTIAFGFPVWTFGVIAGAIWAEQSWGRYWGWDPKETSAFLTWVAYAGYLHARATRGFRGRRAAYLGLVAFGVLMFTYFAVNLVITGLHSYAGV